MDWRRLLIVFAKQIKKQVETKGNPHVAFSCFIVDDTELPNAGRSFEVTSRTFNHVTKTYQLGYKLLLLARWMVNASFHVTSHCTEAGRLCK